MDEAPRTLPVEARQLLDGHLDAVERVLAESGVARAERRAVCDEIDTQAQEMLWQRTEDEPSVRDVHAILAELDPPSAYRQVAAENARPETTATPVANPKVHTLALCSLLVPAAMALVAFSPLAPNGEVATFVFLAVTGLVAVVLAVISIREIRCEPLRYSGIVLALCGALAIPLLVLNVAVYMFADEFANSHFGIYGARKHQASAIAKQVEALKVYELQDNPREEVPKVLVPQLLAKAQAELAAAQLTPQENLIASCEPAFTIGTMVIAMATSLGFSVFALVQLNRRCRATLAPPTSNLKLVMAR